MVYYPTFGNDSASIGISGGGLTLTSGIVGPLDGLTASTPWSVFSVARLLRGSYTGSALRVQRSSDSTQMDIGFVSGILDTTALLSFCGSSRGDVVKLYDQSGNGHDLVGASGHYQYICNSGSLTNTIGGKPTMSGGGWLSEPSSLSGPGGTTMTVILVADDLGNTPTGGNIPYLFSCHHYGAGNDYGDSDDILMYADSTPNVNVYSNGVVLSSKGYTPNTGFVVAALCDGTNATLYMNRVAGTPGSKTSTFASGAGLALFTDISHGKIFQGAMSEAIILSTANTTDLTTIETGMSSYFGTP